jgi:hypothetical protein
VADYVLERPSASDQAEIDEAIARSIEVLPQFLAGDMQGGMHKLHTVDKPKKPEAKPAEEKKAAPKKAEEKAVETKPEPVKAEAPKAAPPKAESAPGKKGLLGSLFGKKK